MKKPKTWTIAPSNFFNSTGSWYWKPYRVVDLWGPHALEPKWQKRAVLPLFDNYWMARAECLQLNAKSVDVYAASTLGSQKRVKRTSKVQKSV